MSVGLLAITLLLRWSENWGVRGEVAAPEIGLDIVVSSRGTLLPARVVHARSRLHEAIVAGERILVEADDAPAGLRAASFGADHEIADYRNFAIAEGRGAVEEMLAWLVARPVPSICILGTSGDVSPDGASAKASFDEVLEELGAQARPHDQSPCSWAYIGVRLEAGWVPLAESYSESSGVVLLFTVGRDLRAYADHTADFVVSHLGGVQEIPMERDATRGWVAGRVDRHRASVGEVERPGLLFDPEEAEGGVASIGWDAVRLGVRPYLSTQLAFPERAEPGGRSAVCEVWVDGVVVKTRELMDGASWASWAVDLGAYARKTIRLELRTRSRMAEGVNMPAVVWGAPQLRWRAE